MACLSPGIQLTGWVSQVIFITVNSILFISSVIGNSLVIYLVWSKAALRSPTYLLMSFLAASDLLKSLFGQLLFCVAVTIHRVDFSCNVVKPLVFMNVLNCTSSFLLLSLIARDRHILLSNGRNYLNHTSSRFAITASIVCYLLGAIVGALITFNDRSINASGIITFAVLGTSSFIIICIKSRQIMKIVKDHIRHMEANRQNTTALENTAYMRSFKIEKSLNRSIFSIIILYLISWTPIIILMIILAAMGIRKEPITDAYRVAFNFVLTAVYLNSALNPVVYSYRCDAIGQEIRRTVAKVIGRARTAPTSIQQKVLQNNGERKYACEEQENKGGSKG